MASSTSTLNFQRLRQDLGDLVRGAADWWTAQLPALLPEKTAFWLTDAGFRTLLVVAENNVVQLRLRDRRGQVLARASVASGASLPAAIGGFLDQQGLNRDNVAVGLQLPEESFFVRQLTLPREVGRSVQTVALHDLLKKTPFREDEIHHAYAAQPAGEKIRVTQNVVRRKFVEAAAAGLGIEIHDVAFVEMSGRSDGAGGAPLIRLHENHAEKPWLARLFLGLVAMLFVLGLTGVVLHYQRQQASLDDLAHRLVAARAQAQKVRADLDAANRQISTANQLRSRKRDGVRLLQLWEELSHTLPSDSWISELRIGKGDKNTLKVTLTGFSAAAANLVGIVDHSPMFSSVSLTAPIAVDPVEQRERFVLQATVDERQGETPRR